ncbi:MAG: hypothetical protein Q9163_004272 [Psora crenata]
MKLLVLAVTSIATTAVLSFPNSNQITLGPHQEGDQYLIELRPGIVRWVTENEKWALRRVRQLRVELTLNFPANCAHAKKQQRKGAGMTAIAFPKAPVHNDTVFPLLRQLNKNNMYKNLERFTSFHTRYYKSDYGAQSSAWLHDKVKEIIEESDAGRFGVKVGNFVHPWGQNSIIVKIPGKSNKTIIIGAHQDSINLFLPSILAAPGADDDGSGTVTILEALRVLLKSEAIVGTNASNTVEFHWYSAEEGGLLGSQAVFSAYEKEGRDVKAMLQQDMTGYKKGTIEAGKPESVGVITDFVDPALTEFVKQIVTMVNHCGYACSDHASAAKAGYPSAFVIESEFKYSDKRIHTTLDTIERLDFDHMLQHARLTLAAVYELAFAEFD